MRVCAHNKRGEASAHKRHTQREHLVAATGDDAWPLAKSGRTLLQRALLFVAWYAHTHTQTHNLFNKFQYVTLVVCVCVWPAGERHRQQKQQPNTSWRDYRALQSPSADSFSSLSLAVGSWSSTPLAVNNWCVCVL